MAAEGSEVGDWEAAMVVVAMAAVAREADTMVEAGSEAEGLQVVMVVAARVAAATAVGLMAVEGLEADSWEVGGKEVVARAGAETAAEAMVEVRVVAERAVGERAEGVRAGAMAGVAKAVAATVEGKAATVRGVAGAVGVERGLCGGPLPENRRAPHYGLSFGRPWSCARLATFQPPGSHGGHNHTTELVPVGKSSPKY